MKRYLKATVFTFVAFIITFSTIHQIIHSAWGRNQILSSLTQFITANTPLKTPEIIYKQVSWGGFSHPLSLTIDQIEILDNRNTKLSAEKIYLGWSLVKTLQGDFLPSWLSIKNSRLHYKNQPAIHASFTIHSRPAYQEIIIDHLYINPEKLKLIDFFPASIKEYLAAIHLPAEGKGNITFTPKQISKLHLTFQVKEGVFAFPPSLSTPIPLHNLQVEIAANSPHHLQATITTQTGQTHAWGEAQIVLPVSLTDFWQQGGNINLHLSGNVTKALVNDLSTLWPANLAPIPREWVTTNLSSGSINGTINTEMTLTFMPQAQLSDLTIHDLSGDLYPTGVTVSYFGELPKVEQTKAHCTYTQKQFIINSITGIVNGLQLAHGHIVIDDLHKADQSIQITLDLIGNVARAFEIISAKPLFLLQKLGLSLQQPEGLSTTHVFLKFPLETGLDLDQVYVEANAHIADAKATLDDIITGYPLAFTKGDFDLNVNRNHLHLSGLAHIADAPATLEWTEYFNNTSGPFIRKLQLQARKSIIAGNSDSPLIKGTLPIDLLYEKGNSHQVSFYLKAPLDDVILNLPWFSYHKSLTDTALLELEAHSKPNEDIVIHKGSLNGTNINLEMSGKWGDKTKKITTSHLKIGDTQGKLSLVQKNERLKLQGHLNEIDIFPFLNSPTFSENSSDSLPSFDGDVHLKLDKLVFSNTYDIKNITFIAQLTKGELQTLSVQDTADEFHFALTPAENGIQTFNLEANNAAELLELFTPGNDFSDGKINFVGHIQRPLPPSSAKTDTTFTMDGEIDIRNLTVHEAPTLAKILSLSSVDGILQNLSGKGLKFDQGHAHISWKPGEFSIHQAYLTGTALGLTFAGTILGDQVNLTGEVIPFYSINNVLSQIPIVGKILSGNSEHAVFSTPFILSGHRKNLNIQVQPLTTLAPGGMRKIFQTTEESPPSPPPASTAKPVE